MRRAGCQAISVDGLGELEIFSIVRQIEDKIDEIEAKTKIVDNSKLALLAAFEFVSELNNLKNKSDTNLEADSRQIDEQIKKLENALGKKP